MPRRLLLPLIAIPFCAALAADAAMPLPAPTQIPDASKPVRQLQGIDCTFGVACPILWSPPPK